MLVEIVFFFFFSLLIYKLFSHGGFWGSCATSNWDGRDVRREWQSHRGPWGPRWPRPCFLLHAAICRRRGGRTAHWLWTTVESRPWQSSRLHQLDRPAAVLRARGVCLLFPLEIQRKTTGVQKKNVGNHRIVRQYWCITTSNFEILTSSVPMMSESMFGLEACCSLTWHYIFSHLLRVTSQRHAER